MNRKTILLLGLLLTDSAFPAPRVDVWDFKVYLNDTPVGSHRFTLTEQSSTRELRSEARFDVKFLMINAYTYVHKARESWRGNCLAGIRATTDDNGELTRVEGALDGQGFRLNTNGIRTELPGCIMTFAYWNPDLLAQTRLLNPQTGEYTEVRIDAKGDEQIPVQGRRLSVRRYRLDAGKFQIDLWYGVEDRRWLALDSTLEGGRRLRYRIE
jgi:hypothetical protein